MQTLATLDFKPDAIMLNGELTFDSAAALLKMSLPQLSGYTQLNFDLQNVTHSNSAGVALLLAWVKWANKHQKTIQFQHIPANLVSILAVSGLSHLIS